MSDLQQFYVVEYGQKKVFHNKVALYFLFCFQLGSPQFWFPILFVYLNHPGSFEKYLALPHNNYLKISEDETMVTLFFIVPLVILMSN